MAKLSAESRIAFLPAGEMNTALALKAQRNGHQVTLWFHSDKAYDHFQATCENPRLEGIKLPGIRGTTDIEEVLYGARMVVFGPRARDFETTLRDAAPFIESDAKLVSVTKGFIEIDGEYLSPSQLILRKVQSARDRTAVLLGPNFARQIAEGKITGTTVAAYSPDTAKAVKDVFDNGTFWVDIYSGANPLDAEIIAAFKNVTGLAMGFGRSLPEYAENTGGFILQKGLQEAALLCEAMGGDPKAIMELCGVGDFGLLMNSTTSRNVEAGEDFGMGRKSLEELMDPDKTVEGIGTAKAVRALALRHRVFMPLTRTVYKVLYEGMDPSFAVRRLLMRGRN